MANFEITHTSLTPDPVYLYDFGTGIKVLDGATYTLQNRDIAELTGATRLQADIAAGRLSLVVVPSADELASGLLSPPNVIQPGDLAPVAAAAVDSPVIALVKQFTAAGPGVADDVTVYAVDNLPYKCRVLGVLVHITTAIVGETVDVRDEAAGAGTLFATVTSLAAASTEIGLQAGGAALLTPALTKGLFLRRSDNGLAGWAVILVRRES